MGFFSEYKKAQKDFKKKHPVLTSLSENNKKKDINKRMNLLDLTDEEKDAVINEGYEPEDFEDDELEEDDYYYDEK